MKSIILKTLFVLFPIMVFAGGETQNGGGAAEQNFSYALTILKPLYKQCLAADSCLRPSQKAILRIIFENLDEELLNVTLLKFRPNSSGRFYIDGQIRIAYTEIRVGSSIYINQDLIYTKGNDGKERPYSVGEAIGVLTHELGHHVPVLGEHDFLDSLGANVRAFFENKSETVRQDNFLDTYSSSEVSATVIHFQDQELESQTQMWLNVDGESTDINERLRKKIKCDQKDLARGLVRSFRLGHLHWGETKPIDYQSDVLIPLYGQLLLACRAKDFHGTSRYRLTLHFRFARHYENFQPRLKYIKDSLKVEIEPYQ